MHVQVKNIKSDDILSFGIVFAGSSVIISFNSIGFIEKRSEASETEKGITCPLD